MALASPPLPEEPHLAVHLGEQPAYVGRAYQVRCEVTWRGRPDAYSVLPAEVSPIEWGSAGVRREEAVRREEVNVVTQHLVLVPDRPGDHAVPEICISVFDPEAMPMPGAPTLGPGSGPQEGALHRVLRADPFTLRVRTARSPAWVPGGLGVFFAAAGLAAWWAVRRRRQASAGLGFGPEQGQERVQE